MTERFARANLLVPSNPDSCNYIVTVKVVNGDYHELGALDPYHAETKLHEFARNNRLIITEHAGFSKGSRAVRSNLGDDTDLAVSSIAPSRFSSSIHRRAVA